MADGGELTIRARGLVLRKAEHGLSAGQYVLLDIRDSGIGIPPDMVERAFDPFFSDDGGRWTGFALANARAVLVAHGGKVRLESDLGRGSTYHVFIPSTNEEEDGPLSDHPREEVAARSARVLVVDDEEVSLRSMQRLLSSRGYEVTTVNNGRKAIELCEQTSGGFDVMVLDLLMPGLSGKSVLEAVHARYPDIRVLVVTGYSDQGLIDHAMDSGASACLRKPFNVPDLLKMVRKLAEERSEELP